MKRLILHVDEEKCTGCGLCVPSCAEGALQIIDGKVRLVNETFCDGLGACLGECPEGALQLEEREAPDFDQEAVEKNLSQLDGQEECHSGCPSAQTRTLWPSQTGTGAGRGHGHEHHGHGHDLPLETTLPCGCPSSSERVLERPAKAPDAGGEQPVPSQLGHWPVQLALISPRSPFLKECDLLIAADCVPFAYASFHQNLLVGRSLLIGCPKLDDANSYVQKLAAIFSQNKLRSVTVAHMEVPCCFGLMQIVRQALRQADINLPLKEITITVDGEIEG